ncbi:hypothetical protein HDU97_004266 [Phlyctochytrium planicorne]|nr:hypothetical protein HDU97_004266 [Phlyctochytrium planicorne]
MTTLLGIDLGKNQLAGPIPSLSKLTNLQYLGLANNQFNGSIPEFIASMTSLRNLDLSDNQFSGTIPSSISQIKDLEIIANELSGEIPPSIFDFRSLKEFRVNSNNLYGELPIFRDRFPQTTVIEIHDNFFSGKIPDIDISSKLKVNFNCYSEEELLPVVRQFLSQGNQVNVTQRPAPECETFLAQIKGASVTQAAIPTNVATSSDPNTGSSQGSNLSLILGLCISGFVVVITLAVVLARRYRYRNKLSSVEVLSVFQESRIELAEIGESGDKASKRALFDTPTIFQQTVHVEKKDGNLFRNLEPYSRDDSTEAGSSSGSALPGMKVEQQPAASTSENITHSDSGTRSQYSDDISKWKPDQVASALVSAGVNLDFIKIMKGETFFFIFSYNPADQGVDGNQLVQLDHGKLQAMGIGPFDARVLLLIAIGMVKENNDVDRPPGYASMTRVS